MRARIIPSAPPRNADAREVDPEPTQDRLDPTNNANGMADCVKHSTIHLPRALGCGRAMDSDTTRASDTCILGAIRRARATRTWTRPQRAQVLTRTWTREQATRTIGLDCRIMPKSDYHAATVRHLASTRHAAAVRHLAATVWHLAAPRHAATVRHSPSRFVHRECVRQPRRLLQPSGPGHLHQQRGPHRRLHRQLRQLRGPHRRRHLRRHGADAGPATTTDEDTQTADEDAQAPGSLLQPTLLPQPAQLPGYAPDGGFLSTSTGEIDLENFDLDFLNYLNSPVSSPVVYKMLKGEGGGMKCRSNTPQNHPLAPQAGSGLSVPVPPLGWVFAVIWHSRLAYRDTQGLI